MDEPFREGAIPARGTVDGDDESGVACVDGFEF
jgi:hypothetical protein